MAGPTLLFARFFILATHLNAATGSGDVEKVSTMGVQQTMVAVKSYGHYIFVLTHLAEEALTKTVVDHVRLEGDLKKADEELKEYKTKRDRLREDFQKYEREKTRLDGVVENLTKDKERLSAELKQSKKDLGATQVEVERCNKMLKGVSARFPNLSAGSSLVDAVEELKGAIALSFEDNFKLALAQLHFLYHDVDESQFDVYKVVRDWQIVEEEEEPNVASKETPAEVIQPTADLASVGDFLLNNESFEEDGGNGDDHTMVGQE